MNCIIIDDDVAIRKVVGNFITKTDGLELIETFDDPVNGVNFIRNNNEIDVVFLDVEMPGMSGLEMMSHIKLPQVILMSSHLEYAVDAFDYNVTDFLAKPIEYVRFLKAINKLIEVESSFVSPEDDNMFFIKDGTKHTKVNVNDIIYTESLGDYIRVFTVNGKHTVLSTMKNMENRLSKFNFARIHRSHIINISHISEFEENSVKVGDKLFTVSRFYKSEFLKRINLL